VDSICVARDLEKWGDLQLNVSDLMKLTFKAIDECDFLLVEMTVKGVGLGIEAGYAHPIGKPIVVIARRGADISGTLSGILSALHFYSTEQELKDVLCKIVSFLRAS
jgi:hypothetical protein